MRQQQMYKKKISCTFAVFLYSAKFILERLREHRSVNVLPGVFLQEQENMFEFPALYTCILQNPML